MPAYQQPIQLKRKGCERVRERLYISSFFGQRI